jgi:general secretion pathway protein B
MSFILDALRKSEHERERKALPGLADVPVARPDRARTPVALIAVGALLAVNLVVLAVVLWRSHGAPASSSPAAPASPPAAAAAAAAAAPAAAPAAAAARPTPAPREALPAEIRPLSAEAGVEADEPPPYTEPPPVRRDPTLAGAAAPRVSVAPAPLDGIQSGPLPPQYRTPAAASVTPRPAPAPAPDPATAGVPSINDLAPQATAGLPPISLALHVYASDPAQRFVVINGRRYQEGAQIQEGPTLERITPDGAILSHRGLRFLLPRQ